MPRRSSLQGCQGTVRVTSSTDASPPQADSAPARQHAPRIPRFGEWEEDAAKLRQRYNSHFKKASYHRYTYKKGKVDVEEVRRAVEKFSGKIDMANGIAGLDSIAEAEKVQEKMVLGYAWMAPRCTLDEQHSTPGRGTLHSALDSTLDAADLRRGNTLDQGKYHDGWQSELPQRELGSTSLSAREKRRRPWKQGQRLGLKSIRAGRRVTKDGKGCAAVGPGESFGLLNLLGDVPPLTLIPSIGKVKGRGLNGGWYQEEIRKEDLTGPLKEILGFRAYVDTSVSWDELREIRKERLRGERKADDDDLGLSWCGFESDVSGCEGLSGSVTRGRTPVVHPEAMKQVQPRDSAGEGGEVGLLSQQTEQHLWASKLVANSSSSSSSSNSSNGSSSKRSPGSSRSTKTCSKTSASSGNSHRPVRQSNKGSRKASCPSGTSCGKHEVVKARLECINSLEKHPLLDDRSCDLAEKRKRKKEKGKGPGRSKKAAGRKHKPWALTHGVEGALLMPSNNNLATRDAKRALRKAKFRRNLTRAALAELACGGIEEENVDVTTSVGWTDCSESKCRDVHSEEKQVLRAPTLKRIWSWITQWFKERQ